MRTASGETDAAPDSGAAAVEFALVSVLLFAVLFGILQYGMVFFQMQAASSTARQVARLASVGVDDCDAFDQSSDDVAEENELPDEDLEITTTFRAGSGTAAAPEWVDVSVHFHPTDFNIPFVPFPSEITRTARARVETLGSVTSC